MEASSILVMWSVLLMILLVVAATAEVVAVLAMLAVPVALAEAVFASKTKRS